MASITLSRREVAEKMNGDHLVAIHPETLVARILARDARGFVAEAEGMEDLFPVSMAWEGYLPGGDWCFAITRNDHLHDGAYRSYSITWIE